MWRGLALIEEKILTTKPIRSRSTNQNSHERSRIRGSALSLFGVVHLLIDETRILFTCRDFPTSLENSTAKTSSTKSLITEQKRF
jgi:hypothetical protein